MNKIKMKSRTLIAFTIIAMMMTVIIGGTFAWFTSVVNIDDNTATAGSIEISAKLSLDDSGLESSATASIDSGKLVVSNFAPGDVVVLTMTVTNDGNNNSNIAATMTARADKSMLSVLTITANNTALVLIADTAVSLAESVELASGATKDYSISISFNTNGDNSVSGSVLTFDLAAFGTQINQID